MSVVVVVVARVEVVAVAELAVVGAIVGSGLEPWDVSFHNGPKLFLFLFFLDFNFERVKTKNIFGSRK